ncbi:hypothetical protein BVC93_26955 [Mycobacterium sp. MS1601]|uniref:hypothetical protein n=1 Tax=Mycobacterium sp. MS1601 TaxID=1936029 RepID=UPI000979816A|nr:hypothetical protein [Mycobacterium sp. MS1601]AQA05421.1 hypothetical protein BVC93_26955 [Mycobacterium sp. MS1601]
MNSDPARWPSLRGHCVLASKLFGDNGFQRIQRWLEVEVDRVDNRGFAREFSEHVDLPGVAEADYAHRVITTSAGTLIGGIRFYGRDIGRPFVEVVCHDFADLDELADCVHHEWIAFGAAWARLHDLPGALRVHGAVLDDTVFAASCGRLTEPDGRVTLAPFADTEDAVELVAARYAALAAENPELARNVRAADRDDLRTWHRDGTLLAVIVDDNTVGALAVAPGRVLWIDGYEINEEVILTTCAGNNFAASAQAEWARRPGVDPERLLVGTIDRLNVASRRTARRAGRHAVLESVFIPLRRQFSAQ